MEYKNIYHLVSSQASIFNDKTFAIFPEENSHLTYKELLAKSSILASNLIINGISKSQRIVLLSRKSKIGSIAYVACLFTGALVLFVDEKMSVVDMKKMVAKYKADLLLYDASFEKIARELSARLEKYHQIFPIEENIINKGEHLPDFCECADQDDPAICVYTSGSTGEPKCIVSTHRNIFFGAKSLMESLFLTPKDRVLSVTPFSGTNGQVYTFWSPFYTGGSGVYYQGIFTPFTLLKYADLYKATWINATPTHYSLINSSKLTSAQFDLTSLRFVRTSSAPLPQTVQEEFEREFNIVMVDSLGLSETAGQIFVNSPDFRLRRRKSVGRPVMIDYKIIDTSTGKEITNTEMTGEIIVKCDGLTPGYLDDEAATANVIKEGWLWTGDLGYRDKEGFVYLKGRKKDIAIIGGKNVSLAEVDEILYSHPEITNAISCSVPETTSGEKIISFITVSNLSISPQEIIRYFHQNSSPYKSPKEIYIVNSLPLGGAGKILRAKVKEWYLNRKKEW